jgi:S-formylglutathione hydrolase FrmB
MTLFKGHSAGGFAAFWLGLRHIDRFQAFAAHSGVPRVSQIARDMMAEGPQWLVLINTFTSLT